MEQTPQMNEEILNELKMILGEKFSHIIKMFLDGAETNITTIKSAFVSKDYKELLEQAHSLKGTSANVGAIGLSEIAARVQTASNSENRENLVKLIEDLFNEWDRVKQYFDTILSDLS